MFSSFIPRWMHPCTEIYTTRLKMFKMGALCNWARTTSQHITALLLLPLPQKTAEWNKKFDKTARPNMFDQGCTPRGEKVTPSENYQNLLGSDAKLISIHWNTEGNYKEGSKLSVDLHAFLPRLANFYPCPTRSQKGPPRAPLLITWPGPKISNLFDRSDLPWVLWHGLALVAAVEKHQVLKDLGWISDDLRESTASLLQHLPFSILIRTVAESQNESANHREVAAEWKSQSVFRN